VRSTARKRVASLQGTDQLAVIDTGTGRVIGQVGVGRKPVGVAASL
jgi:YVTN family beta-propeller protein